MRQSRYAQPFRGGADRGCMSIAMTLMGTGLGATAAFASVDPVQNLADAFKQYPPLDAIHPTPEQEESIPNQPFYDVAVKNRTLIDSQANMSFEQWLTVRSVGLAHALHAFEATERFQNSSFSFKKESIRDLGAIFTVRPASTSIRGMMHLKRAYFSLEALSANFRLALGLALLPAAGLTVLDVAVNTVEMSMGRSLAIYLTTFAATYLSLGTLAYFGAQKAYVSNILEMAFLQDRQWKLLEDPNKSTLPH